MAEGVWGGDWASAALSDTNAVKRCKWLTGYDETG